MTLQEREKISDFQREADAGLRYVRDTEQQEYRQQ